MVRGWLLDAYADYDADSIVLWLWTPRGPRRVVDRGYRVPFFVSGSQEGLRHLSRTLEGLPEVTDWGWSERRTDLRSEELHEVLEVQPRHYGEVKPLAELIDDSGGHYDYRLYNVDLRLNQRYLHDRGVFPSAWVECNGQWKALEKQFALDYELPPVGMEILDLHVENPLGIPRLQDKFLGFRMGEVTMEGTSEAELMEGLMATASDLDPDILLTDGGDSFLLPYLINKAKELGMEFKLGREAQRLSVRKGKSYFTYGKIVHKPGQYMLRGRVHLDRGHFAYREARLYGPVELSRLSKIPMQEMSRLTPGTAFTAMQINEALRQGVLVLWKKNLPEIFKTAEELVLADRGGFIFEPEVGIHEGIYEIDFSSLYPSIMITRNISYETLNCSCCAVEGRPVPVLPYYTCTKHKGLVPIILEPLVHRRRYYKHKRQKSEEDPNYQRDSVLKWTLVTSFGYQGYKNARYGRIECHEAINAYAREILLRSMEIAEAHGYEVVHGIVDSLWLRAKENAEPLERVVQHIGDAAGIPLDVEGRYKWIVFLPCKTTGVGALNRYYGLFETGELKLRGIELRKHDTAPFINTMEEAMLGVFSEANNAVEFKEKIPRALDIVRATLWKLQKGDIPVEAGVLTKVITKPLEEYLVLTTSVAALRQMQDRGFKVEPGEYIRFIITKESSRDYRVKVKVAEFLDGTEKLDAEAYTKLVCRAAETLLSPFGYTEAGLMKSCSPLP